MSNRITWRDVQGPNFRDSILAQRNAADLLGQAFSGFAGVAKDIRTREKDSASNAAVAEALRVSDASAWDRLMAEQGLAGLGANPNDLNATAMEFLQGRRSGLLDNAQTQASTAQTIASTDQTRADTQIALDQNSRAARASDWEYDRAVEAHTRSEEDRVRGNQAMELVDRVSRQELNPEDAAREIEKMGLDPRTQAQAMERLAAVPQTRFSASAESIAKHASNPDAVALSEGMRLRETEQNMLVSADEFQQFYNTAVQPYEGATDAGQGLIETLRARSGKDDGNFHNSAGYVRRAYEKFKDKYGGRGKLPDEVIARAMEISIDSGWRLFQEGEAQSLDYSAAEKMLAELSRPGKLKELESTRIAAERQSSELNSMKGKLSEMLSEAALLEERGKPEEAAKVMSEVQNLTQQFLAWSKENTPVGTPTNTALPPRKDPPPPARPPVDPNHGTPTSMLPTAAPPPAQSAPQQQGFWNSLSNWF